MKVTIQNLTINIGARTSEPSNLLESLLRNATLVSAYEGQSQDADQDESAEHDAQQDATGETQHNPTQTFEEMVAKAKPQIVEFLQPNEKFSQRTWSALHKAICGTHGVYTHVLAQALRELVAEGVVQTKRRRADGETLYSTNVGAYVAVPPRQAQPETGEVAAVQASSSETPAVAQTLSAPEAPHQPDLTVSELVEFLTSDDRYEFRTLDAIKRHFAGHHSEDVLSLLAIAQSTDDVYKQTRADGTAIYMAA